MAAPSLPTGPDIVYPPVPATDATYAAMSIASTTKASGGGGGAAQGAMLFESLGCSGCHSLSGAKLTGPPLNGVAGTKVKLSTGQTVTADDAYLLRSILDPDADIVQGFPKGIMSATIKPHSVPEAQAKALVAFIKSKQ